VGGRRDVGGAYGLGEGCGLGAEYWVAEELYCYGFSGMFSCYGFFSSSFSLGIERTDGCNNTL
jgi:hypothetical protein